MKGGRCRNEDHPLHLCRNLDQPQAESEVVSQTSPPDNSGRSKHLCNYRPVRKSKVYSIPKSNLIHYFLCESRDPDPAPSSDP